MTNTGGRFQHPTLINANPLCYFPHSINNFRRCVMGVKS